MATREEIMEGIAEYNYYYPDGKPTIRRSWGLLTDEEKKPYTDVAKLQVFKLHSQGVAIKNGKKPFGCAESWLCGYTAWEPLIKEGK